eukprot:Skav224506  [mRNA]  locus=scaffold3754:76660:88321:- [translate_table: standard]
MRELLYSEDNKTRRRFKMVPTSVCRRRVNQRKARGVATKGQKMFSPSCHVCDVSEESIFISFSTYVVSAVYHALVGCPSEQRANIVVVDTTGQPESLTMSFDPYFDQDREGLEHRTQKVPVRWTRACQEVLAVGGFSDAYTGKIRAAGSRRSKEAFGGMRAMLHYYLESSASNNQVAQALSFLDELKASSDARLVSSAAFNALLRGLLSRSGFEEAQWLRNEMLRFGVAPNEALRASLNLLMDTAARSGSQYLDEAWDILEESHVS